MQQQLLKGPILSHKTRVLQDCWSWSTLSPPQPLVQTFDDGLVIRRLCGKRSDRLCLVLGRSPRFIGTTCPMTLVCSPSSWYQAKRGNSAFPGTVVLRLGHNFQPHQIYANPLRTGRRSSGVTWSILIMKAELAVCASFTHRQVPTFKKLELIFNNAERTARLKTW